MPDHAATDLPGQHHSRAAATGPLHGLLDRQRNAASLASTPDLAHRRASLARLDAMLHEEGDRLHAAISADFGHRAYAETVLAELVPLRAAIRFARRHLGNWMRPRRRRVGLSFQPGQAWIMHQPLGCIGIVSPWNYPLFLSVGPLIDALAAGNRVMLKPSELTPRFADLLAELLARDFAPEEVTVVIGGPMVAQEFCALPFDHLLFTGSTGIGRAVMQAAASTLTPVTLELGGKSPAIVAPDADPVRTARSLMIGKLFNAGQTCIAPDYALVPQDRLADYTGAFLDEARRLYPRITDNPDYSSIVSDKHLDRLRRAVHEAAGRGAAVLRHPDHQAEEERAGQSRRMVPTLVLQAPDDGILMRDEIFGPVLPVIGYRTLDEAIAFVNARPTPLALYCYTDDRATEMRVLSRTVSGGATINGTLLHCAQPDLPFGGVGPSGTGAYHGETGFLRFSHTRGIYRPGRISGFTIMAPPHGRMADWLLPLLLGRRRGRPSHRGFEL